MYQKGEFVFCTFIKNFEKDSDFGTIDGISDHPEYYIVELLHGGWGCIPLEQIWQAGRA